MALVTRWYGKINNEKDKRGGKAVGGDSTQWRHNERSDVTRIKYKHEKNNKKQNPLKKKRQLHALKNTPKTESKKNEENVMKLATDATVLPGQPDGNRET